MASLVIVEGTQAGKHFPLAARALAVGRDPARDIQLLDPKVSRKHFQVRPAGDQYVLFPFKSLNGISVNGQDVQGDHALSDRDRIEVGDTVLMFLTADDPDRTNALNEYKVATRREREDRTIQE